MSSQLNDTAVLLKKLRLENSLTQEQVSKILNISRPAYTFYETGETKPNFETLFILANLYGVDISIFCYTENTKIAFSDSEKLYRKDPEYLSIEKKMGELSKEEREIIGYYRIASPIVKRKIYRELTKITTETRKIKP